MTNGDLPPRSVVPLPGRRWPGKAGLSLVEVLIALTLLALLGMLVASLLPASSRSAGTVTGQLERRQLLDLAAELLAEEVGLAGAAPWPLTEEVAGVADPAAFLAGALSLSAAAPAGHRLAVRFLDHRLAGPPLARDLSFDVGVDARGQSQLYRRAGLTSRQPLVEGIDRLEVSGVVLDGALIGLGDVTTGARPWALLIRLASGEEERVMVITLPQRPRLVLAGQP